VIMKGEADNEKLLIRYLLGNLPEEQWLQVEKEFLSDDQRYERLLALEDELFYDYAQNKLSPGEREQFEKRFLSSERNRKRAMIASALARKMSEAAPVETTENDVADREPRHFWRSLKSYFVAQSAAMRVSLAALAIVSLALIWLVIGIVGLRNEFDQFRAQQAVQEDQLRQQAQQERARADELNLKLERETDENATLRQELSKMQAQSGGQREVRPSVISLVLAPAMVRGQAPDMNKLYLAPGVGLVKLLLKLKGEVEYKSYQVTLLTVEGVDKWSRDMLRARRTGSGRSIDLWLPARILMGGDYELILKGHASDGTLEETRDYYYLSVERK
jgi:anti-sigma factor RsiW